MFSDSSKISWSSKKVKLGQRPVCSPVFSLLTMVIDYYFTINPLSDKDV
ncbi:hypothetical protein STRDD11_02098 [Streptococcus sp. DD11]|nr:hypothetical protein STRDD11_02098 [Streptococcus sp. DD11]